MICVYKITSPTKRVYIGSTINFKKRLNRYKNIGCKNQVRLYNSLKKYGFNSHKVEIICECVKEDVRQKEAYYGQLFNCLDDKKGLNCHLPVHGEGFINKTKEAIEKQRLRMIGKKASEETKAKMRASHKSLNRVLPEDVKKRIGDNNRGKVQSVEQRTATSARLTGLKWTDKALLKRTLTNAAILLNPQTGIYYYGVQDAAKSVGMSYGTLYRRLYQVPKPTPFIITQ